MNTKKNLSNKFGESVESIKEEEGMMLDNNGFYISNFYLRILNEPFSISHSGRSEKPKRHKQDDQIDNFTF